MRHTETPQDAALQRASSLVMNAPGVISGVGTRKDDKVKQSPHNDRNKNTRARWGGEIIPDSEEERLRTEAHYNSKVKADLRDREVIELSSDEDDNLNDKTSVPDDPFIVHMPGTWPAENAKPKKVPNLPSSWTPRTPPAISRKKQPLRSRRVIVSSSSDDSDDPEILELTDSSPERPNHKSKPKLKTIQKEPTRSAPEVALPLYIDEDDDGAILTLNEPKSSRKPIRLSQIPTEGSSTTFLVGPPEPSTPRRHPALKTINSSPGGGITLTADPTPLGTPSRARPSIALPSTPASNRSPTKPRQPPRTSKKAQAAAEQLRRGTYAQRLFVELNRVIFNDGLPHDTKLNWNKRLLTTAGRAKWHRSRDGVHSTEIELAEKILDSDERIRNTLSHEMCHLACWVINGDPKEGHGKLWKGWAAKVMRKRPDIEVSTKHDYEISYPFEWECEQCAKIYGRFSKSIRPDECVCGACKVGTLVPLFAVPQRDPKTPKTSRMAAGKAQDSPSSLPRPRPPPFKLDLTELNINDVGETTPAVCCPGLEVNFVHGSDSESSDPEVEILTTAFGSVTIAAT